MEKGKRARREERLQWLEGELHEKTYPNAERMAETHHVSLRTAQSDYQFYRNRLGQPVAYDHEHGGWYFTATPTPLPFLPLTSAEASALRRALLVAREYLGESESAALARISRHAGKHIESAIPRPYEGARGAVHLLNPVAPVDLLTIDSALQDRRKITFLYTSPRGNETLQRIVRPYHLDHVQGEWYLIAHCETRDALRTFHTARMNAVRLHSDERPYAIPPDFDAERELNRALLYETGKEMETVIVDFDMHQAPFIRERKIHHSDHREETKGGGLRLTLQIPIGDEVMRWLLGYGHHVTVVAPESLRQKMMEEIKEMGKKYQ